MARTIRIGRCSRSRRPIPNQPGPRARRGARCRWFSSSVAGCSFALDNIVTLLSWAVAGPALVFAPAELQASNQYSDFVSRTPRLASASVSVLASRIDEARQKNRPDIAIRYGARLAREREHHCSLRRLLQSQ